MDVGLQSYMLYRALFDPQQKKTPAEAAAAGQGGERDNTRPYSSSWSVIGTLAHSLAFNLRERSKKSTVNFSYFGPTCLNSLDTVQSVSKIYVFSLWWVLDIVLTGAPLAHQTPFLCRHISQKLTIGSTCYCHRQTILESKRQKQIKDKKTTIQKDKSNKSLILWCQGSFALLQCFHDAPSQS